MATGEIKELIDGENYLHLVPGDVYKCRVGSEYTRSRFVDWIGSGHFNAVSYLDLNLDNPSAVELEFEDADGFRWSAYFDKRKGVFCAGSSGKPLYVEGA